ncbi:MAG: winged helix-turn-helix transcriptional regulator [Alphaproteobacteria bacterium]|nr:winged helix-turn-helix transcriptional regulator [Alphaproteobacteria bacterium]
MAKKRIYGQFCPVAIGAEVFANKWTPLLLRELMAGSRRFGQLRKGVPLMSRSLLAQRLRELTYAGLVKAKPLKNGNGSEYFLTDAGEALRPLVIGLGEWAQDWLGPKIRDYDLDPGLLMWDIQRNVDVALLPPSPRTIVEFQLAGVLAAQRLWWLHVEKDTVDLCFAHTGFENDLVVRAHLRDLTEIWMGQLPIPQALAAGKLTLEGDRKLCQNFPKWFTLSDFAPRAHEIC